MGTDITNKEQQPRETHEPKKASKITITTHSSTSSPRLGQTETPKTKPASSLQTNSVSPKTMESTVKAQEKTRLPTVQEEAHGCKKSVKKCKKQENFKSRLVKPPQTMQEEPFVRSPSTSNNNNNNNKSNNLLLSQGDKSSLSINDLVSFTSVPSLHTIIKKKDSSPHKSVIKASPHPF